MKCLCGDNPNIVYTEITQIEENGKILKVEVYNRCECGNAFMTTRIYKLDYEYNGCE